MARRLRANPSRVRGPVDFPQCISQRRLAIAALRQGAQSDLRRGAAFAFSRLAYKRYGRIEIGRLIRKNVKVTQVHCVRMT